MWHNGCGGCGGGGVYDDDDDDDDNIDLYSCISGVGTLTTVQLALSGIRLPFGLVDTYFEDLVAQSLHKVLTYVSVSAFSANNALTLLFLLESCMGMGMMVLPR